MVSRSFLWSFSIQSYSLSTSVLMRFNSSCFSAGNTSVHILLALKVSVEKSAVILMGLP
jgi:hypothetical protein